MAAQVDLCQTWSETPKICSRVAAQSFVLFNFTQIEYKVHVWMKSVQLVVFGNFIIDDTLYRSEQTTYPILILIWVAKNKFNMYCTIIGNSQKNVLVR